MVSKVAKSPVSVPKGVEVTIQGQLLKCKGSKGQLEQVLHPLVAVVQEENELRFSPRKEEKQAIALTGTMRSLANNMVHGVDKGFERKLTMVGVGYRAQVQGNKLNISAGFSHPVVLELPEGVTIETPTQTEIVIKGANKQIVGQVAANIRAVRPPEPYKGKGIRYSDEKISLKETKKK